MNKITFIHSALGLLALGLCLGVSGCAAESPDDEEAIPNGVVDETSDEVLPDVEETDEGNIGKTSQALSAWGKPNWCTHHRSIKFGAIGWTTVEFQRHKRSGSSWRHYYHVTLTPYFSADTATVEYNGTRLCSD